MSKSRGFGSLLNLEAVRSGQGDVCLSCRNASVSMRRGDSTLNIFRKGGAVLAAGAFGVDDCGIRRRTINQCLCQRHP